MFLDARYSVIVLKVPLVQMLAAWLSGKNVGL